MRKSLERILSAVTALAMAAGFTFTVQSETAQKFVAYNDLPVLDFETTDGLGAYQFGDGYENGIKTGQTDFEVQNGSGAAYFDGTLGSALWGGASGLGAQDGDLISGTYWLKVMMDKPYGGWKLPNIEIYMSTTSGEVVLAKTKDYDSYSIWALNPYTWSKLEIESTGVAYDSSNALNWRLNTVNVGYPFMVDNIQLGTTREYELEKPTDVFDLLNFEDSTKYEGGIYDPNGALEFVYDNLEHPAYKGQGALLINHTKGGYSLWGGGIADGVKEGSTISGKVALRLEQKKYDATEPASNWYKFPGITIKKKDGDVLLAQFDPMTVVYDEMEQYTWFVADIVSTGETFSGEDELQWNIANTAGSGIVCMIDSVNLKITQPEDPILELSDFVSGVTITGGSGTDGAPVFGDTLTAAPTYVGTEQPALTYQWKKGTENIGNGTDSYTVTAADIGSVITVEVTAEGYEGSVTASAAAVQAKEITGVTVAANNTTYNGQAQPLGMFLLKGDNSTPDLDSYIASLSDADLSNSIALDDLDTYSEFIITDYYN